MKELITLQFGPASNFIASQYWKQQKLTEGEELNQEVLFRDTKDKEPRCMIFDFKGSYDIALSDRYNQESTSQFNLDLWNQQPQLQLDPRQDKEQTFTWSDDDNTIYNSRSSNMLNKIRMHDQLAPFESFIDGENAYVEFEKEMDSIDENLRYFAEECDQLQGFQIFSDLYNGFSGFSFAYLQQIQDEYNKKPIILFGSVESTENQNNIYKHINLALSIDNANKNNISLIPLYSSKAAKLIVNYDNLSLHDQVWSHSSIVSSAIDTCLTDIRLKNSNSCLTDVLNTLNVRGNTFISELYFDVFKDREILLDKLDLNTLSMDVESNKKTKVFAQTINSRGIENLSKNVVEEWVYNMHSKSAMFPFTCNVISTPISQKAWLNSYKFKEEDGNKTVSSLGSLSKLQTSTNTYGLIDNLSKSLKQYENRSVLKILAKQNNNHELEDDLFYNLADIGEYYFE